MDNVVVVTFLGKLALLQCLLKSSKPLNSDDTCVPVSVKSMCIEALCRIETNICPGVMFLSLPIRVGAHKQINLGVIVIASFPIEDKSQASQDIMLVCA